MGKPLNYALIYFLEALIMWYYCYRQFTRKKSARFSFIILILGYITNFIVAMFEQIGLNILFFIAVNLFFIFFCFDTKLYTAVFHTFIITIIMGMSEEIIVALNSSFFHNVFDKSVYTSYFALLSIISKLLYFILIQIPIYIRKHSGVEDETDSRSAFMLSVVPLISCWIVFSIASLFVNADIPEKQTIYMIISAAVCVLVNIIVFIMYDYINKQNRQLIEIQRDLQKEYDQTEYFKSLIEREESKNEMIHDHKKQLEAIKILSEEGGAERINAMVSSLLDTPAFKPTKRVSDNDLLNSIINRFINLCKQQNIDFYVDIRSKVVDFLSDTEISSLFYNLLDNAYEAAVQCSINSFIELSVIKDTGSGRIELNLENSCATNPFSGNKEVLPKTTKKDKIHHGYGLKSIKRVVSAHHGHMQLWYDDTTQSFHSFIFFNPDIHHT